MSSLLLLKYLWCPFDRARLAFCTYLSRLLFREPHLEVIYLPEANVQMISGFAALVNCTTDRLEVLRQEEIKAFRQPRWTDRRYFHRIFIHFFKSTRHCWRHTVLYYSRGILMHPHTLAIPHSIEGIIWEMG